jgi:hypothetical protein
VGNLHVHVGRSRQNLLKKMAASSRPYGNFVVVPQKPIRRPGYCATWAAVQSLSATSF